MSKPLHNPALRPRHPPTHAIRPSYHFRVHPALTSFADECCGTLARLIAYVGTLALFAIVGLSIWEQLPFDTSAEAADPPGFTLVLARTRPSPSVP